jgi:hypothetical protein
MTIMSWEVVMSYKAMIMSWRGPWLIPSNPTEKAPAECHKAVAPSDSPYLFWVNNLLTAKVQDEMKKVLIHMGSQGQKRLKFISFCLGFCRNKVAEVHQRRPTLDLHSKFHIVMYNISTRKVPESKS